MTLPNMAEEDISYAREALLHPWNLVFLVVAMVSVLLAGAVDSTLPQVILMFAAALELLYLGTMPRNERFQRAVRAKKARDLHKPPTHQDLFRQLTKLSQRRYVKFRNLEKSIRDNYKRMPYSSQGMLDAHLKKIDDLLNSYLSMLWKMERYDQFTKQATEREVVSSIEELRAEIENDPPRVRAIKEKRLDILRKRLDRFKKAHEHLAVIQAQLETIEDVAKYIHEQSFTMRNPEEVSFQLDTLIAEVEETQATVTEMDELVNSSMSIFQGIEGYESSLPSTSHRTRTRN